MSAVSDASQSEQVALRAWVPLGLGQRTGRQLVPGDLPVVLAGSEVLGRGRSGRQGKEVSPAGAQGQGRRHFGLTRGFEDVCQQGLCVW